MNTYKIQASYEPERALLYVSLEEKAQPIHSIWASVDQRFLLFCGTAASFNWILLILRGDIIPVSKV